MIFNEIFKECGKQGMLRTQPLVAFALVLLGVLPSMAMDRVVGSNATLDIEPGARSAALGSATMAVDGDYLGLMGNPYQLSSVRYTWGSFSHTQYYEDTKYDYASVVTPIGDGSGFGISLSRFGADDIPLIEEGEALPEGSDYRTLSIADWVLGLSFGHRITDNISVGVAFNMLYRDMDQSGFGFRGDAGLRYRVIDEFYLATFLKGWTSSATKWESGTFEYSSPELYLAASYSHVIPYLYGSVGVYWQGAGLFHNEARDVDYESDEDRGNPVWKDPLDWLSGGRAGLEFIFDFGLSVRAGLSSFSSLKTVTAGAGLVIAKFLKLDYAFESHPTLSSVHRVSLSVSPYLFGHVEETPKAHVTPGEAAKKPLVEDDGSEDIQESYTEPKPEEKKVVEEKSAPEEKKVETPSVENSEEILETAPRGGTYWEE